MKYIILNKIKIYKVEIAIFIGLIVSIICCFANLVNQSEDISNHILRIHILANSDTEEDQNLKLQVRDEILNSFNFNYTEDGDLYEIEKQLNDERGNIENVAKDVIKKAGYNYNVESEIVNMYFDTREYDGFAMPAGKYDALRLKIGEAKGHNWWCVLVPSLCVPAANGEIDEKIEDVLNKQQQDLIETGCKTEVRFAIIEAYEYIKDLFS